MPRFIVIEQRAYREGYLIDAVDEEAAQQREGEVISESETDSWADELLSCEEVDDDVEDIEL